MERRFSYLNLLWLLGFGAILWILPTAEDPQLIDGVRSAAVGDLLGAWNGEVESRLVAEGIATSPSRSEVFRSFFTGKLPDAPPHRGGVRIGTVSDSSAEPLSPEAVRELVDEQPFLAVTDDPDVPPVNLRIERQLSRVVVEAESPLLCIRAADDAVWGERFPAAAVGEAHIPGRTSVLPPLVAIFAALITRRAVVSLVLGIAAGAGVLAWSASSGLLGTAIFAWFGQLGGLYRSEITDQFRLSIILFVLCLVGMVGVMTRMGGTQGIVDLLMRYSSGVRSTRVVTALMGLLVFFDDYSNSVIVGSSMRPLTDKMKIAREKLAYLIDSTAAPVAGIALFSTWIGYEVSQYQSALAAIDSELTNRAYGLFIETIPYRFYCIFTLIFVLANVFMARDFGSMLAAERRAAQEGKLIADGSRALTSREFTDLKVRDGVTPRARNAIIPLGVVLLVMIGGFWVVGQGYPRFMADGWSSLRVEGIGDILSSAYILQSTVVAAVVGSLVAVGLAMGQRILSFREAMGAWFVGFRSILLAVVILFSAWAIAGACNQLGTGSYLGSVLGDSISLVWLPLVIFLLACVVAFATGTSWGTMAILLPISIPMVYAAEGGLDAEGGFRVLTLLSFGAVLEGAIFGDHCSPISDTTVLASVSAGSDHIDHVRTQIPYALTTMTIAMLVGYIPVSRGWYSSGHALILGSVACVLVLWIVGRPTPEAKLESGGGGVEGTGEVS